MEPILKESDHLDKNLSKISSISYNYNTEPRMDSSRLGSFSSIVNDNNQIKKTEINNNGLNNNVLKKTEIKKTKPIKIIPRNEPSKESDSSDDSFDGPSSDEMDFEDKIDRMMTSETPPDPFINIQARTRLKWVDDGNADSCGLCNEKFRMFLRRHHCILEGTPVTLSNGMARKIEHIYPNQKIPSWNPKDKNIEIKYAEALLDQGEEPCMKVTLEDGRSIVTTSDHEILSISPECSEPTYVMMKNLTTSHRLICSTLEGVLDDPSLDQEDYISEILGTSLSIKNDREKCLIFASLFGYSLCGYSLCGYNLTDGNLEYNHELPEFITDTKCPLSMQREFVAGLLGHSNLYFNKTSNNYVIQNNNGIKNIMMAERINEIINNLGVKSKLISGKITSSNNYEFNFELDSNNIIQFSKKIGFRYSLPNQTKLTLIASYENYKLHTGYISFSDFLNINYRDTDKLYFSLRVVSKPQIYDDNKPKRVYDLSVPDNVSFVANGIIVHNCRVCGSVFCATCSDYWNTIPECINHIPSATGTNVEIDRKSPMRMCKACDEKIILVKKLEILLKSIQIADMDIFAFKSMGQLSDNDVTDSFIKRVADIPDNKEMKEKQVIEFAKTFMNGQLWKQLANFYLSKFREIQYKLIYQEYTDWEKTALWTNYKNLKDHDIWMVHAIRAFANDTEKLRVIVNYYFTSSPHENIVIKDRDECWERMCTKLCQKQLSWENALMLLEVISTEKTETPEKQEGTKTTETQEKTDEQSIRNIISTEIVRAFSRCDDEILECIIPSIIYRLVYDDSNQILINFVMSRCVNSARISNHVYWMLSVEKENNAGRCDYLISRLFREISAETYNNIMEVNNFVRTIEDNYSSDDYDNPIHNLGDIKKCISPTHPEKGFQIVSDKAIPGELSANRPVPILLSPNTADENIILYKNEDMRTDLIVMSIIRIIKRIIEESLNIDLHVVTYNIQPTSKNTGFIGAVNKSNTLYKIEEKFKSSLTNYIRKHNPETPTKELKERFIRSCAFYSVITFLLGIGDRHLDNIMLTENGELFHIDYGFILGKDPRPMKTPYMRISEGMLDAIGGHHSEEYEEFKELCNQIYEISRRHVNTFVCMLSLLPKQDTGGTWTNPKISDNRVLREIVKRFAPGETYEKAKSILHTRIDKSTNMTNRSKYHIVDFFHRHNKEGTIRNIVSTTVGYGISGTANLMTGIWDYVSNTIK